jgi:predicted DNA-binding protein
MAGKIRQKVRIQVYLEVSQKQRLEKIHEQTGAPVAELIRRAVEAYLKREA